MATIRDVAKLAGVAPITVSRVLNKSGYVSPETQLRVETAAAELNYVPNMLAHSLRSNRTQTLALVLTDITNPFWTTVARGVEDEANAHGFNVIFCNTDENPAKQDQYISMLLRRRVDGVLLVPATSDGAAVSALRTQGVQVVVLDRRVDGGPVDVVRGGSEAGAQALADHLLDLGHRCIAVLTGPSELSVSHERVAGFKAAYVQHRLQFDDALVRYGAFTVESGYAMAMEVLTLTPQPTAIFAANNFIAIGALRAFRRMGLRTPEDVSIVVFDDLPDTFATAPFLTVVAQPAYLLGKTATEILLARIASPATSHTQEITLPASLIIRTSTIATAPPPPPPCLTV
ncbi:MAG: LacI family DNA-binding transcriptional regulator [Anaerolineales bacterium]|nr:LacI family DNA-binding transcriptional regulator [Anaerolineales bacterium]